MSRVSQEHEGVSTHSLDVQGMVRGRKESAAPTMCWGHHLCEMFPSLSAMEEPKRLMSGSSLLLCVTV